jgi:hypothetical protein
MPQVLNDLHGGRSGRCEGEVALVQAAAGKRRTEGGSHLGKRNGQGCVCAATSHNMASGTIPEHCHCESACSVGKAAWAAQWRGPEHATGTVTRAFGYRVSPGDDWRPQTRRVPPHAARRLRQQNFRDTPVVTDSHLIRSHGISLHYLSICNAGRTMASHTICTPSPACACLEVVASLTVSARGESDGNGNGCDVDVGEALRCSCGPLNAADGLAVRDLGAPPPCRRLPAATSPHRHRPFVPPCRHPGDGLCCSCRPPSSR